MKFKDYYAVLGVGRDADADTIKKAYRILARQHHPDVSKVAGAESRFKEIGEAYATLKDAEKRAAYDQLGARPAGEEFTPPPKWRQEFAGDGEAFGAMDMGDLLDALARGRRGGHGAALPRRGHDYEAAVRISLEDAHRGTTVSLDVEHEDGTRTLAVTVPPGATEGQRLRLRGRGQAGAHGGPAGDIYLHIHLTPHEVFRVDRHDLYLDVALAPWEAVLGADVEVATLDGPLLLTVPPGSRSSRKLRMRARGLATGHGGRGDLYAVVHIDVPSTLTPEERELFEKLSQVSQFRPRVMANQEKDHEVQ